MIEPEIFAVVRAIPEAQKNLCILANSESIAAAWEGQIIFFRSTDKNNAENDITNTMQYISTQYRNAKINLLILLGINYEAGGIPTLEITDEYISAKGLAMRTQKNFLDLRTQEYIHGENQRKIFSTSRMIFCALAGAFSFLSLGTIFFALSGVNDFQKNISDLLTQNEKFFQMRAKLSAQNSKLEKEKNNMAKIFDFMKYEIPTLEILKVLEENSNGKIKIDSVEFLSLENITIEGRAENDAEIFSLVNGLQNSRFSFTADPPIFHKDNAGISFIISLKVSELF